jgi:hypothetical protein
MFPDKAATDGGTIERIYEYRDAANAVRYQKVRYKGKGFSQRQPNGSGGWTWGLKGIAQLLYRLPELKGKETVYITEGEKDADRLASLGFPATTSGSCDSWNGKTSPALMAQLIEAGAQRAVVFADHDAPGLKYCANVARGCAAAGLPVKIVDLYANEPIPDKHGKDVSDWLDSGHTRDELVASVETAALFGAAIVPGRAKRTRHIAEVIGDLVQQLDAGPIPTLKTPFAQLDFFLGGGLVAGELVFLGARPGVGKTALALEFVHHAATQGKGPVLVVSREMVNVSLGRRMVSQAGRIRASSLKRCELDAGEMGRLSETLTRLSELPVYLTDCAVDLPERGEALVELGAAPSLIVVDYLQLVRAPREIKDRRHQVEAVSSALKELALRIPVPVLCMTSLSRPPGNSPNSPPTLASLRESGRTSREDRATVYRGLPHV